MGTAATKGKTKPKAQATADFLQYCLIFDGSKFKPTIKRNKTKPSCATMFKEDKELEGKIVLVKPGINPITLGPRITPCHSEKIKTLQT